MSTTNLDTRKLSGTPHANNSAGKIPFLATGAASWSHITFTHLIAWIKQAIALSGIFSETVAPGNIPVIDSDGLLADSGKKPSDFYTKPEVDANLSLVELKSNKVTGITDANKASTTLYPTIVATENRIDEKIDDIKAGAPAVYDTLNEIADKLAADDDVAAALAKQIAEKADKTALPVIVDNLASTSSTSALSANQGRILKSFQNGIKVSSLTDITNLDENTPSTFVYASADFSIIPNRKFIYGFWANNNSTNFCAFVAYCQDAQGKMSIICASYNGSGGWNEWVDTAKPTVEVVDNLTSTSTTASLSAKQGKLLDDGKVDKWVTSPDRAELAYMETDKTIRPSGLAIDNLTSAELDTTLDIKRAFTGSSIDFDGTGSKQCAVIRRDTANKREIVDFAITYEDTPKLYARKIYNDDGIITLGLWTEINNKSASYSITSANQATDFSVTIDVSALLATALSVDIIEDASGVEWVHSIQPQKIYTSGKVTSIMLPFSDTLSGTWKIVITKKS